MRTRFVIPFAVLVVLTLVALSGFHAAWATDGNGQNTYASAQASGGQLTVQAGVTQWTPPSGSPWAQEVGSDPPPGKVNPNQPYGCTYGVAPPQVQQTLGPEGSTPGQWVYVTCTGPGVINPMPLIWVTNAQPATVAIQVNPVVVAQQAASQLALASPTIEMAPPAGAAQLVGVATWLWIDQGAWQALTATASVGTVTTTATALPTKVVWDMGDGHSVTCDGPGIPYDPSNPNGTTDCSYTWSVAGSYHVTATVYWSVSWTVVGAAGGGNLGVQAGPAAQVPVTVTESQAINTSSPGGN
jgi:hypothetical protein